MEIYCFLQYCKKNVPTKVPRDASDGYMGLSEEDVGNTSQTSFDRSYEWTSNTTQDEGEFRVSPVKGPNVKGKRSRPTRKARKAEISDMESAGEDMATPVGSVKSR